MNWLGVLVGAGLLAGAGQWAWERMRPHKTYAEHLRDDLGLHDLADEAEARAAATGEGGAGRKSGKARRVLVDRFGRWPKLWLAGTLQHPVVTLQARYASPDSIKSAGRVALFLAFMFGFWLTDRMARSAPSEIWWQVNAGPVVLGIGAGWVSFFVFRILFRMILWRIPGWSPPLTMRFQDGGISWTGEMERRQWWRLKREGRVAATEARHAEKLFPHRRAAQELRDNDERRMRGRKARLPSRLVYQQCSEVVMFVGPDLESWRPVAELAGDEHGQWAGKLATAINAADELARGKGLEEIYVISKENARSADRQSGIMPEQKGLLE